jgi:hypothetical protein
VQEFGPEWAKEHLVPQVLAMVKNPHYLYRMTVLVAISSLANYVSQEVFVGTMLPVLVTCAKDRVPNVKFNVAKVGALKRRPFCRQHTRSGTLRAHSLISCPACILFHGQAAHSSRHNSSTVVYCMPCLYPTAWCS